jgi:hypothetical protein
VFATSQKTNTSSSATIDEENQGLVQLDDAELLGKHALSVVAGDASDWMSYALPFACIEW